MKNRISVVFSLFWTLILSVQAQTVSLQEAYNAANCFLNHQHKGTARCVEIKMQNADTLYYVFNGDDAYAIIAADRRVMPVLAFSNEKNWDAENVAPAAQMWYTHYAQQIATLRQQPYRATDEHPSWAALRAAKSSLRSQNAVEPLMQSHWGQENNYNYFCPADAEGPGGHVVTGCVASVGAINVLLPLPRKWRRHVHLH